MVIIINFCHILKIFAILLLKGLLSGNNEKSSTPNQSFIDDSFNDLQNISQITSDDDASQKKKAKKSKVDRSASQMLDDEELLKSLKIFKKKFYELNKSEFESTMTSSDKDDSFISNISENINVKVEISIGNVLKTLSDALVNFDKLVIFGKFEK